MSRAGLDSVDRIETVTSQNFDSLVLEAKGPVAVEFMSYGCAHCREIEPILQRVAELESATEKIYRLNVSEDQDIADAYDIEGTPTIIKFMNGVQVGRAQGPTPDVQSVLDAVTQPAEE